MLEERLLEKFRQQLDAEIIEKVDELDESLACRQELALAEVFLAYLEEAGLIEEHLIAPHKETEGRNQYEVTACAFSEDSLRIDLFLSKYISAGEENTLPASELKRLAGRIARFFGYAARNELSRFPENTPVLDVAKRIAREHSGYETVSAHILTNATVKDRSCPDIEIEGFNIQFSVYDVDRLHRASQDVITRDQIEIDFKELTGRPLPCLESKYGAKPKDYESYLLTISGELIYELYEKFGARLFEFNVRSFLQAKGKVNKGLRETIKIHPERFLAYNNGLTATADDIEAGLVDGQQVIKKVKGLQIVNGAQTTASIHRAKKVDKLDISDVSVSMKLTLVKPDKLSEFVPLIAQYANTQNVIQIADLSANNQFHISLEQLSHKIWCPGEESRWFYERARGAYQALAAARGTTPAKKREFERECPKANRFSKTDAAKFLMTYWLKPQTVSRGAQKNFVSFMADLPSKIPSGEGPADDFYRYLVALAIIFRSAQSVVRSLKLQSYGANVVAYMLSKFFHDHKSKLDFMMIWSHQKLSDDFVNVLKNWAPRIHQAIIESAGKTNVTEWCKKDLCWEHIRLLDLPLSPYNPPELCSDSEVDNSPISDAEELSETSNINLCVSLDYSEWTKILAWAAASGKIPTFEQKVTTTLVGYSMDRWKRRPSDKQAEIGARVINEALKHGIIERS